MPQSFPGVLAERLQAIEARSAHRLETVSQAWASATEPEDTGRLAGQMEGLRACARLMEYFSQRVGDEGQALRALAMMHAHFSARQAHLAGYHQEMSAFIRELLSVVRDAYLASIDT